MNDIASDSLAVLRTAVPAPGAIKSLSEVSHMEQADMVHVSVGTPLAEVERLMIAATLKRCGGNKTRAAAMLGVSLKTLYNRLNEYRASAVSGGTAGKARSLETHGAPPNVASM